MHNSDPEVYWEHAGEVGYGEAMFKYAEVEHHVNQRLAQIGIDIGTQLGLNPQSHILDLGCGDGALTNTFLAKHYKAIDGFDLAGAAIKRAQKLAPNPQIRFEVRDITKMDYTSLPRYDGAYLWGILHHVKSATPDILRNMRPVVKRIVILEPNGNHLVRKLLERTATYKAAGEDSFKKSELEHIFSKAGYRPAVFRRLNLFPNFTPKWLFQLLKPIEPLVERTPILQALCTVNMWGFVAHE